jgi:protein-S-isoprenylcysteine O-methyltransferase Ste14
MGKITTSIYKILYGILFAAIVPLLLFLWAKHTSLLIKLPMPSTPLFGYILLILGALLIISGMWHLLKFGKGLPMNAFPPSRFVTEGIYSVLKHPIYTGAALISFGISAVAGSASGYWMVSPLFTLMMVAYVTGFENERTERIFGKQNHQPFLSLPESTETVPAKREIIATYFLAYIPWLVVYETFIFAGKSHDSVSTNLPFEDHIPVIGFTVIFYVFIYVYSFALPLIIKTGKNLRKFITDAWSATIIVGLIYFLLPLIVTQKEIIPDSFFDRIIYLEHTYDGVTAAFPSFHVIWAFISGLYFSRSYPRLKILWYTLAILITISCVTTSSHSLADIVAGYFTFLAVLNRGRIWNFIRLKSEQLSNSWREWRIGPVRLINHGLYGGAAGFAATLIAGFFTGSQYAIAVFIIMIFVIIGAALWAQFIEGSPKLLRPYGYYGGLIGGLIACIITALLLPVNLFTLLASFALAGPWIQSLGRLRCLVQGCCHGKPSNENIGIRFTHPYSRVNKISGLKGVPLHPTQLYSIGANVLTGFILIRLFYIEMPSVFIAGVYFIMNGLGRFVEESFRGEAQTPYWAGMRIYQWIALINIIGGAILTTIPDKGVLTFQPNFISFFLAIGTGILVTIASGVDFPESNRRFARLTSN